MIIVIIRSCDGGALDKCLDFFFFFVLYNFLLKNRVIWGGVGVAMVEMSYIVKDQERP